MGRAAAALFLAWFTAISVLATQSSSTIARLSQATSTSHALQASSSGGISVSLLSAQKSPANGAEVERNAETRDACEAQRGACSSVDANQVEPARKGGAEADASPGAEPSPGDEDCCVTMAPPGDDVPPEVEVDLESEPWLLSSSLQVPPVAGVLMTFAATDDSHSAHVPESSSPPPRA